MPRVEAYSIIIIIITARSWQKRKFWSRVNNYYQETFAHTRIRFGHVRARVVYTTSAFRCFMRSSFVCLFVSHYAEGGATEA